ncbi:hypothetical protein HY409_01070 [Candidatus Gottesmanbacteria bacterium]|nr:hypothetical protein [Candidatus Gottesmanbacteria bacterium]
MKDVVSIIGVIWGMRIIVNVLSYVQLWWIKEYRFDRMFVHLKTDQGKHIYILPFRGFRISPKTIGLVVLSYIFLAGVYLLLPFHPLIRLVILDIVTFPVTAVLIFLVSIPQRLYHRIIIGVAIKKLRAHPNLLVIGITGSYGKTSTKEYVVTILSQKFQVLKTEASKNSAIGIAEVVLSKLCPDHEIFVVEMGAYKKGEIAQMVRMTRPQIGIITAINEQHQDLFGSIVSTMHAKYELIEGLTGKKIAILNADNMYIKEMMRWAQNDKKTVWAYTREQKDQDPYAANMFQIFQQSQSASGIAFHLYSGDKKVEVKASIFGIHQVQNVTAAIAAATACGMTLEDAAAGASLVAPVDRMMKPINGINGSTFIDDTFNNNPEGAIAAIDYLRLSKGKKILVFQPMIELGEYAKSAHERVGEHAARVCEEIILTNKNYFEDFERGVRKASEGKHTKTLQAVDAASHIRKTIESGDIVLFKGKEAARVLTLLTR